MPASTSSYAVAMPHSPAQSWSFRVPSPPRIIVPPPALNMNGIPDLHVVQDPTFDFESSGFQNAEFLKKVTYNNFMTTNNMLEWKYEQRRMAQQILPFLYLGPMAAARDKAYLQQEGITMVLAIRNTMSAHAKLLGTKAAQDLGLETRMIDVAGNQELIAAFPKAIEVINSHLSFMYQREQALVAHGLSPTKETPPSNPGRVLVFCETGNERSATLVAAYIMAMYSTDLITAIQIVQAQRFAVAFDDSLRNLLSTYGTILQAKRDVVQATNGNSSSMVTNADNEQRQRIEIDAGGKGSKRGFDTVYDDDDDAMVYDDSQDYGRFEGRDGVAPFQDNRNT